MTGQLRDGEHRLELRVYYEELFACEARHYRTYVDLACQALRSHWQGGAERDADAMVQSRLSLLAEAEGKIVRELADRDARATVHG